MSRLFSTLLIVALLSVVVSFPVSAERQNPPVEAGKGPQVGQTIVEDGGVLPARIRNGEQNGCTARCQENGDCPPECQPFDDNVDNGSTDDGGGTEDGVSLPDTVSNVCPAEGCDLWTKLCQFFFGPDGMFAEFWDLVMQLLKEGILNLQTDTQLKQAQLEAMTE